MIDDYRERFALSADPFAEGMFYPAPTHMAVLEALLHDLQFGIQAVVLTGAPGTGKSTLLGAAQRRLPQEVYRLEGGDFSSSEQLLLSLAEELLLPVSEDMQHTALEGLIASLALEQDPSAAPVILVDDAENLPQGAMLSLLKLAEPVKSRRALRLVLVCPPGLATQMPVQLQQMPFLPLAEACELLNYRMTSVGYTGPVLFEASRVEPWWQKADGNIARLQAQAQQWLLTEAPQILAEIPSQSQQGRFPEAKTATSPLPLVHMISAAALIGALAFFYLYRSGDENVEPKVESLSQPVEIPTIAPVVESSSAITTPDETPLPEEATSEPSKEELPNTDVSDMDALDGVESSSISSSISSLSSAASASSVSDGANAMQEADEASSAGSLRPPESRFSADEQRLLSWPADEYTLQVLAVSRRESATAYQAQFPELPLLIVETRRQGKPWFVVVVGRYTSTDNARQHSRQLPPALREARPWPRHVGELQRALQAHATP